MNLHRPFSLMAAQSLSSQSDTHPPPSLSRARSKSRSASPASTSTADSTPADPHHSRERCISLALELVQVLCDAHDEAVALDPSPAVPAVVFHYCYFVFDAAVALAGGLAQDNPPHPRARECLAAIDRAVAMLEASRAANVAFADDEASTASRATTILAALRKAGRWDERFRSNGAASPTASAPAAASSATAPVPQHGFGFAMPYGGSATFPAELTRFGVGVASGSAPGTSASGSSYDPQPSLPTTLPFFNPRALPSSFGDGSGSGVPDTFATGMSAFSGQATYIPSAGTSAFGGVSQAQQQLQQLGGESAGVQGSIPVVNPFDMLQHSDSFDIDWAALMPSPSGWTGEGAFTGGGQTT